MTARTIYSLVGALIGGFLTVANAHHLHETASGWIIRYGSIGWALLTVVCLLNFADELRKRSTGPR